MASTTIAIVGYIILIANTSTYTSTSTSAGVRTTTTKFSHPWVSFVGMFFAAAGIYPSVAMILSWPAVNVSGQTKRATAGGLQISIGNLGAVIGTQIYRTQMAPRYYQGHAVALAYLVGNLIVTGVTWWLLSRENKKRAALQASTSLKEGGDWEGDEDQRFVFTT